jgi:2,4-dienoyl-CoA reductase-like NADH-dependent reductase (Old Yellow Enzyme family)
MELIRKPLKMRNLTIKNRLAMPPVATYKGSNGSVSENLIAHYQARAEGGNIGLLITEHFCINKQGSMNPAQICLESDEVIPNLEKMVKVIKENGTKTICQLNHAGSATTKEVTGFDVIGPSPIVLPRNPQPKDPVVPKEMSIEDIQKLINDFASAAIRAKKAGYDGVEIHSAHGYLLNQFYSPLTNHRTDNYGGSLDKRLNLHREVIRAVRKAVGPDYFVALRLGGSDYMEGGSSIKDAVYAAKVFEEEGIDMIDLSGGMCRYTVIGRNYPGYFKDMSKPIKDAVKIPVLLTGGVHTIEEAEALLEEGVADIIGVGRELLKDPKWADKAFNK